MKVLIFAAIISVANCLIPLSEVEKSEVTRPDENPYVKAILREKHPELYDEEGNAVGKTPFIIGGSFASLGQFPHQALLLTYVTSTTLQLCGGSFIDLNWILTAAHCVEGTWLRVEVYLGIVNYSQGAFFQEIVTSKSDVKIHSGYVSNNQGLNNDIAMIRLRKASTATLSNYISLIPLPTNFVSTNLVGMSAIVSGFGLTNDNSTSISALKYTNQTIIANSICEAIYTSAVVRDNVICVSTTRTSSSCNGDSGGPLTVVLNQTTHLVGVVSFGHISSCELAYPTGYARVTSHLAWIQNTMNMSPKDVAVNALLLIVVQFFFFLLK